MGNSQCKVCKEDAEVANTNGFIHVRCIRCGDYFIVREVIEDNQDKLNDQIIITKLSGWIRENPGQKIDDKLFAWLLNKLTIPNVYEKAQKLLKWINSKTTHPGRVVSINLASTEKSLANLLAICWAYNDKEIRFLIDYLVEQKFLNRSSTDNNITLLLTITHAGFSYLEELQKNPDSNLGFCAMWFDKSLNAVWENSIEPAIKKTGYDPKRIDKHPHNGVIVDEIISLIRRSKFLISDLTGNRGGVYFEAGFAKGFGLEVIFTCRKDFLSQLHFDVRHYNFLVWENENYEEFKTNLTLRIESTLGRGKR